MARWTASAKWAVGPALDGRGAMPLALRLSEGLGIADGGIHHAVYEMPIFQNTLAQDAF